MVYIKNPTREQKQEWAQKARQNEKEAYDMIRKVAEDYKRNPEHLAQYFSFAANFYEYSPNNVSLIYGQNENALFVQSFKAWKDMDASILKGAKGIKILVPQEVTFLKVDEEHSVQLSHATKEQKELYQQGLIDSYKKLHFGIGNVFDISQTTYPKEKYPELFNMGYSSDKHQAITQGLIHFSENEIDCPVKYEDMESITLFGYYVPSQHRIALNHLMEDTMTLSTMSHELGHALAHHELKLHERSTSQKEFEGDAISIMLQHNFEIELTEERKSHLASHFRKFHEECKQKVLKENPQITPEKTEEKINALIQESFSNVFNIYRNNIEVIEEYVFEELEANVQSKEVHIVQVEDALKDMQRAPRRYSFDEKGNPQRLWNGKTAEQFTKEDTMKFLAETDMMLQGRLSEEAIQLLREQGYVYENGILKEISPKETKVRTLFLKNGIDADKFENWLLEGKLHIGDNGQCQFIDKDLTLDISLNQFVNQTSQIAYYGADQELGKLFVTQNTMEFIKALADERSTLLVESGADIDVAAQLPGNHKYQSLEFGTVREDVKSQLQHKVNIQEIQHTKAITRDIQMEM